MFHLGALRRLNELKILSTVRTVSSVSGGSIAAAHLATVIAQAGTDGLEEWSQRVARPLLEFKSADRHTRAVVKRLLP